MYLTRAFLDPSSRAVRADMRNPEGLHKTVMRAFPDDSGGQARRAHGVLHRLDQERADRVVLLIQSHTKPMIERWPQGYLLEFGKDLDLAFSSVGENPAIRRVDHGAILEERSYAFRLRANTTKKVDTKTGADGVRRNGRRVPLRGHEERLRWLARHAELAGFVFDRGKTRVLEVAAIGGGASGKGVTVGGALFEGILVVKDADRFREALGDGIGPAKAYGFGLLSIAPIR